MSERRASPEEPRPGPFVPPGDEAPVMGPDGVPLLDDDGNPVMRPVHPGESIHNPQHLRRRLEELPDGGIAEIVEDADPRG